MCEIFGLSAARPMLINGWLMELRSHSEMIQSGWGLAVMEEGFFNIEKEAIKALDSSYLKRRLQSPVITKACIAHLRHAKPESMQHFNCHPFSKCTKLGRQYTLAHNGAIFSYDALKPYESMQKGTTDSEQILLYLVDQIDRLEKSAGRELNPEERFSFIDGMVCSMSKENRLNIVIHDGELLYAHSNRKNDLFYRNCKDYTVICTKPVDKWIWYPVPFTTLLAFKNGRIIYSGTEHKQEFIQTDEHLRILGFLEEGFY